MPTTRIGGTEAASIVLTAIAALPYATVQGIRYVVSRRASPTPHAEEDGVDRLAWWRLSVLGWAAAAAAAAPVADVHHGHDLTGLPAAIRASRRQGGAASVIYDSHELFIEAGDTARQSPWVRRVLASLERRWIAQVAGIVTVNESIAGELHRRYGGPDPVIVRNAPPKTSLPEPRPDHLRIAAGIPAGAKVVLYHGGFQRDRGLEVLAEAMLEPSMAAAHLVYMGFGPLQASLEAIAADPRFVGRIHVLPAVDPGVLLDWVASADVSAMPNQPRTLNERYSTPNKLFESIAVGTPVVSSDFPERRRIVIDDPDGPLGAVCDPTRASELARALAGVLDLDPAAADDLRRRCHRAATLRWNWELESARLLELYRGLPAPQTSSGSRGRSMTLRVLVVARGYPSHDAPGRGSSVADHVALLRAAGADVTVASFETVQIRGDSSTRAARLADVESAWARAVEGAAATNAPASTGARPASRWPGCRSCGPGVPSTGRRPTSMPRATRASSAAFGRALARRATAEGRPLTLIHAHTGLPDGLAAVPLAAELRAAAGGHRARLDDPASARGPARGRGISPPAVLGDDRRGQPGAGRPDPLRARWRRRGRGIAGRRPVERRAHGPLPGVDRRAAGRR